MAVNVKEIYTRFLKFKNEEALIGKGNFAENKHVWVMVAKDKYQPGEIVSESGNKVVLRNSSGEEFTVDKEKVDYMNPPKFDGVEDCAELSYLNEAAVLHNLRKRYESDIIYVIIS